MTLARSLRIMLLAAAGAFALALSAPLVAAAAPVDTGGSLQARVDAVLAEYPGGTQTASNEITWEGGAIILTLETPSAVSPLAVGSCASGYYCAYSNYNLSGSKLSISICNSTQPTTGLSAVRSIANARSSGYVQAKNASGSVLATVASNASLSYAPANITQLTCVS